MPQIDVKYSNKMDLNFHDLFTKIEQTINKTDSKAGLCKCRAIPIENYLHDHILINISLLKKSHRDKLFMSKMLHELDKIIKPYIPKGYTCSIELKFLSEYYLSYIS